MTTSPTTDIQPEQSDIDAATRWKGIWGSFADRLPVEDLAYALARHRLTFTTPTLGDMVMVPREPTEAMWAAGREAVNDQEPWSDLPEIWSAMLSAAPASPIPISVNGTGERERIGAAIDSFSAGMLHSEKIDAVIAALSPALDNTAVEGQLREAGGILAKALETIASRKWNSKPDAVAIADAALLASQRVMTRATLTAETEKAR